MPASSAARPGVIARARMAGPFAVVPLDRRASCAPGWRSTSCWRSPPRRRSAARDCRRPSITKASLDARARPSPRRDRPRPAWRRTSARARTRRISCPAAGYRRRRSARPHDARANRCPPIERPMMVKSLGSLSATVAEIGHRHRRGVGRQLAVSQRAAGRSLDAPCPCSVLSDGRRHAPALRRGADQHLRARPRRPGASASSSSAWRSCRRRTGSRTCCGSKSAWVIRTCSQSASISSAISIGSMVLMPWPISGFLPTMVIVLSGAIET